MKKIIALLLAFMLAVLCVPVQAASYVFSVKLSADDVKSGEQLCLTVDFGRLPTVGLCGFELQIKYDKDALSFVKAEASGFPAEGAWMAAPRAKDGVVTVNTFDDKDGVTHVYDGTKACVKLYFDTAAGTAKQLGFEIVANSVSGCYFDGTSIQPLLGSGTGTECELYSFPTQSGEGWYFNDGYLYCEPDTAVGAVGVDGKVAGKSDTDTFTTGDIFVSELYRDIVVGVLYDVNGDSYVTTADCLALKLYIKRGKAPNGGAFAAADVNMDGELGAADVLLFLSHLSEK